MLLGSYSVFRPGVFELPLPDGGAGALKGSPLSPQPCSAWLGAPQALCSGQGWCGGELVTEEPCRSLPGVCCSIAG